MNLHLACRYGYIDEVKAALKNGADPSIFNNEAITIASAAGRTEVVKVLLQDDRVDPSDDDNYAIEIAIKHGHVNVVKALLQDGRADPTADHNYSIFLASSYGRIEIVKLLLEDGRVQVTNDAIEDAATEEIKDMLINYRYRVDGPEYCKMKGQSLLQSQSATDVTDVGLVYVKH